MPHLHVAASTALLLQGWRLDPLLLFGQLMTTGAALSFAIEALRLRSEVYEGEVRGCGWASRGRGRRLGDHGDR